MLHLTFEKHRATKIQAAVAPYLLIAITPSRFVSDASAALLSKGVRIFTA